MSHGGPRENSGRKAKFTDEDGNPIKSGPRTVPEVITDQELQELARQKLKQQQQQQKETVNK